MRPFIGNRKGFELLKANIDAVLSSEHGVQKVEYEDLGFSELKIQESLPPIEPVGWVEKVTLLAILGFIMLVIILAIVGFNHLVSK